MLWPFRKPRNSAERFWKWFEQNAPFYEKLQNDPEVETKLNAVTAQLRLFDKRLTCEFLASEAPVHEFIISADGQREAFSAVESLVAAAPSLPHWKIIAFRQRGNAECVVKYQDIELGPHHMRFRLEGDGDRVGIHLYLCGVELRPEVEGAVFILLDNALGEYDMETKVGFVERYSLGSEDEHASLKPFEQLPAAFDAFYALTQG
jgi:hypothetical protein